jgi:hypothetical protein
LYKDNIFSPIFAQDDQEKERLKMTFEPEWQFINRDEYEPFLQRIATEVAKLLAYNKANRERFKQHSDRFHKEWTTYEEVERQLQKKEPIDPCLRLITGSEGIKPRNKKEQLEQSYVWLIIIHDWMFPDRVPIDENKHPKPLAKLNWIIGMNLSDKGRSIIEIALNDVKSDLAEKPAETEQKATLSKRQRIWIRIKKIPHWIYYILGAFAALLTILHYLGWIEPIKNLFTGY